MPFYTVEQFFGYSIDIPCPLPRDTCVMVTPSNLTDTAHQRTQHTITEPTALLPNAIPMHQLPLELLLHWTWLQSQQTTPHQTVLYSIEHSYGADKPVMQFSTNPRLHIIFADDITYMHGDKHLVDFKAFLSNMCIRDPSAISTTTSPFTKMNAIISKQQTEILPSYYLLLALKAHYSTNRIISHDDVIMNLTALIRGIVDQLDDAQYTLNTIIHTLTRPLSTAQHTSCNVLQVTPRTRAPAGQEIKEKHYRYTP